jgi:hypothetical protein
MEAIETHPEHPPLTFPSAGELVAIDQIDTDDLFLPATDEAREVFALAQIMRSTAYRIGIRTPLGERVALGAVRLIYDAQNPGHEGGAG